MQLLLRSEILTHSIVRSQKKVEWYHFDVRKDVFKYDEMNNKHRETIYKLRDRILEGELDEIVLNYCDITISEIVEENITWSISKWDYNEIYTRIKWIHNSVNFSQSQLENYTLKDSLKDFLWKIVDKL